MSVVIIGGGLAGVLIADALHQKGFSITLIDAAKEVAAGTSYANGGQVAVSEAAPWSKPGVISQVLREFGRTDAAFRWRPKLDINHWLWLLRFVRNCGVARHEVGERENSALANFSLACLHETRQRMGAQFHYRDQQAGLLQLFAPWQVKSFDPQQMVEAFLKHNVQVKWLNEEGIVNAEPALRLAVERGEIAGALRGEKDESGDAASFTRQLADQLKIEGVTFRFGETVRAIKPGHVETDGEVYACEKIVIANGVEAPKLARQLGVRLPILPVKGYSLTVDIENYDAAPTVTMTDLAHRLVVTRLEHQMRIAGYAEIGFDGRIEAPRVAAMRDRLDKLLPECRGGSEGEPWVGFRPMTPDGKPIVGQIGDGIYTHCGHGSLGWTLAHGTARALASLMAGEQPAIELQPFSPQRAY